MVVRRSSSTRRRSAVAGSVTAASLTAFLGFLGLAVVLRPRDGSAFVYAPCWPAVASGRMRGERCSLRSATNGFMFFDLFSQKSKEVTGDIFIKSIIQKLTENLEGDFSAVEWEPINLRSTRELNSGTTAVCTKYYLAGVFEGLGAVDGDAKKTRFRRTPTRDQNVPVEIAEFQPGRRLMIDEGACQLAIMRPGVVDRMGAKAFKATFKETHRILQKGGLLLYFDEKGTELPETALNFFTLQEAVEDEPDKSGLEGFLLIRKPLKNSPELLRRRAPGRTRAAKTPAAEKLDLNDGRLGITPGQLKDVFDELDDA